METIWPNENTFNKNFLPVAVEIGVPVSVLKGVAAMESAFNPKAYRAEPQINDASYGLMQILHKTAAGVGYTGAPDGLFDPATNIKYGGVYLAGLLKKYPDLSAAVASYNMGRPRKASETTDIIKKIYPATDAERATWVYANQPYVDRVMSYIAYFQTFERPDPTRRAQIVDFIKKKITVQQAPWPRNPWYPSTPVVEEQWPQLGT